jgi:hypothetical protein
LGRTQYCLGAVVFTLKHTGASFMFVSVRTTVRVSVNGPVVNEMNVANEAPHGVL